MRDQKRLHHYYLEEKNYHYLQRKLIGSGNNTGGAVNEPQVNAGRYQEILHLLEVLEFEAEQIEIVQKILAAIILIGEITFKEAPEDSSEVENVDIVNKGMEFCLY